ncbi:MAG: TonB-dependent receptor plug domain-containing protein [Gammaproteobacteria bacterium]
MLAVTACVAFAHGNFASAVHAIVLPEITVEETRPTGLTTRSIDEAREDLTRVPGGTTLIEAAAFREGAVANLEDVLAFAPGVFAQSRFGGGETRTLIRGSGVSLTFGVRGIRFLRDDLPLNFADGFFNPELLEPLTARYVEVYRGANALEYGAATLGGAVNFASQTGLHCRAAQDTAGIRQSRLHPSADQRRRSTGSALGFLCIAVGPAARWLPRPIRGRGLTRLCQHRLSTS